MTPTLFPQGPGICTPFPRWPCCQPSSLPFLLFCSLQPLGMLGSLRGVQYPASRGFLPSGSYRLVSIPELGPGDVTRCSHSLATGQSSDGMGPLTPESRENPPVFSLGPRQNGSRSPGYLSLLDQELEALHDIGDLPSWPASFFTTLSHGPASPRGVWAHFWEPGWK